MIFATSGTSGLVATLLMRTRAFSTTAQLTIRPGIEKRTECKPRHLYEKVYCARGDMENRIKECQLDLYADRTSAATMRANQLRLWFASMAYVLLCALRRIGLDQTHFANATCGSIRLKLLKIGALVQFSVRRIKVGMASACPAADIWGQAARRLAAAASARGSPV